MFFLISFVFANKYCVGNSNWQCKNICKNFADNFDDYFIRIPTNEELNTSDDTKHDIYISYDVEYEDSNNNLIICDPSIKLSYREPETILIKDHIYADSKQMPDNASIEFYFSTNDNYLTIEVETDKDSNIKPFTIDSRGHYDIKIINKFYTDDFPENLITLSEKYVYYFLIKEITDNVKKIYKNYDRFRHGDFKYYCLSDKEKGCENYASYDLEYINSASQIQRYPSYLIVDTIKPQILITEIKYGFLYNRYIHIVGLPGSDITFYSRTESIEKNYYVILHPDSIEMDNLYYEGEGNFTIATSSNFSLFATSKTTNYHLTLKTKIPLKESDSYIYALREDLNIELNNKIHIPEYSLFRGPKCLSGLFDGRFLSDEKLVTYNVTSETLRETDFTYVTYYFKEGDHEIPKTWKSRCRFQGINPNETNFIFSDVYHYDGRTIDNLIDVNYKPSSNLNRITIKPAKYFYLSSFNNIYDSGYAENYTIVIENDIIMRGDAPIPPYDEDEILRDQCKIVGNGTIRFPSTTFMNQVKQFCQIDENVTLEPLNGDMPSVYICVGSSDIDKCKSEVDGIEKYQDYDWVWIRNVLTRSCIQSYIKTFITDQQYFRDIYNDLTLTPHAKVTIPYYDYNSLYIYGDGISQFESQSNSTKLIILFDDQQNHDNYHYYDEYYSKQVFRIYYVRPPTRIDLQIFFYYENVKLFMKYYKDYSENCIRLSGKSQIFIREPYEPIINIFNCTDDVVFSINPENDYYQILLSNEPIESENLFDFVLCSSYEKFMEYNMISNLYHPDAYIYLDISIDFSSTYYHCRNFYFFNNISISVGIPDNSSLIIGSSSFDVVFSNRYYLHYNSKKNNFTFDIKNFHMIDYTGLNYDTPLIEFTSSLESVEFLPSPTIMSMDKNYIIKIPEKLSIYSAAPRYLTTLFNSKEIHYSKNWTYYHFSNEGKLLYDSHPSIPFENFEKDDNLPENIVLAVGKDDNLTIPLNWTKIHNFYIYQEEEDDLLIYKPLNLTYEKDGIIINHKFKIIAGFLNITVPEMFTVNSNFPNDYLLTHFLYQAKLDCSGNTKTTIYTGEIIAYYMSGDAYGVIKLYGFGYTNYITVISKSSNEQYYFMDLKASYTHGDIKYRFDYDSICYCTDNDYNSKCSGKYFRIQDITTLLSVINDYPELTIWVFNDIYIPFSTGDHFVLNPKDENVKITLPYSPDSMITSKNETLQFNYSDSTFFEIINKSYVDVKLNDQLAMYIESDTNSSITFSLGSDVFVSLESKIDANFSIAVDKNSYHFYTEDVNVFENIFNGSLESYIRVCAYDIDADSPCSYTRNETISKVFTEPFIYNVVEIALSSKPQEIKLPTISKPIMVNILPVPSSTLTLSTAKNLQITPDSVIINEFWKFEGDRKVLTVNLDNISTLSVIEEMTVPIILQLTNKKSFIDLRDFDNQNTSLITIRKSGNEMNEITVFGTDENYDNFINNLKDHDEIKIAHNGTQKYLCICENEDECTNCQEGVDGLVSTGYNIQSDPGEDVKIRVFSDVEIASKLFNNDHEVYIEPGFNLNLTYVNTVNQNISEGLNVDNLHFVNGSNLLLKPRDISLNIVMREEEMGPYFTIEMDTFLRLNVTNAEDENIKSSRIHVNGFGELNCYDYPFDRIRPAPTVKVIKGVYIICNSRQGNDVCSYESAQRFKILGRSDFFRPEFDPHSKILVFLDSYTSDIKVRTSILRNQRIKFIKNYSKLRRLLEGQNRLLLESNTEILSSENSTELFGEEGGTALDNEDSDLFIVGFDENITIKQEGNVSANTKPITIQPMSDKATIIIDDSVDIEKQKLKIESENDQKVSLTILTNKNITAKDIESFIDSEKANVEISFGGFPIKSKKGFPIGAIVGIVVGVVVVVAVVVVIVIFVVKNKKKENSPVSEDKMEFSDSTF